MPRLPKARHCFIYAVTIVLIMLAVIFSLIRAALPHAHGYVADLEQQLSEQIGLTTTIGSIDASMDWFTPRLVLQDVSLTNDDGKGELLHFTEIELSLAYVDTIRYRTPMVDEINLIGGDLKIERFPGDKWAIQGVELHESDTEMPYELRNLIENANYSLRNSSLHWRDHTGEYDDIDLKDVNITVDNFLGEHTLDFRVVLPEQYGDALRASIQFDGGFEMLPSSIHAIYIESTQAQLDVWVKRFHLDIPYSISGKHDLQLWLELEQGVLAGLAGKIDSHDVIVQRGGGINPWLADTVSAEFYWKQHNENWRAYVNDFSFTRDGYRWSEPTNLVVKSNHDDIYLSLNYLDLAEMQVMADSLIYLSWFPELSALFESSLSGDLYNVYLQYDAQHWQDTELEFEAQYLAADLTSSMPGQPIRFDGIDARVRFQQLHGSAQILSDDLKLSLGDMFRQPLQFDVFDGVVIAEKFASGWTISADSINADNADIRTESRLAMNIAPDGEYFMDMRTDYRDAKGSSAYKYYPVSIMSQGLVSWLDDAIQDGMVPHGGFLFYGDAARYPFNADGTFQAEFTVEDASLMFQSGWPAITNLNADVLFDNLSLDIHGSQGRSVSGKVIDAVASIDNLNEPLLKVKAGAEASASDAQAYIRSSPLDEILGSAMNQIRASGPTILDLSLSIPLDDDDPVVKTDGKISFVDNTVEYLDLGYSLTDLSGVLRFTEDSVSADNLSALYKDHEVVIQIGESAEETDTSSIDIKGKLPVAGLLEPFDWVPSPWFTGDSDWDISIRIPHEATSDFVDVIAKSDLVGVTAVVSDVVYKPEQSRFPLKISTRVTDEVLQINADMPAGNQVSAVRNNDGEWRILADTDYLVGKIDLDESFSPDTTIDMELDKLMLSDLFKNSRDQSSTYSLQASQFPPMKINGKKLVWEKWNFDAFELETSWHRLGMLVNKLNIRGQDLVIDGQGSWLSSWRYPNETTLRLTVNSGNLGNALTSLGYEKIVDRGEQTATLDIKWPDAPYRFDWGLLTGTASLKLTDGRVTEVNPGAGGRVLGLLNVFHLPKRLFLNFGDVYKKGFVFDTISGDFDFSEGSAYTKNTNIDAAAADVRIRGRIGMQAQDYDMTMRVKPNQSAAAFTGGTIAGGPVVGAGLVLLQKVFGLDKAVQDRYSITGTWEDPVVTQIEKRDQQTSSEEDESDGD